MRGLFYFLLVFLTFWSVLGAVAYLVTWEREPPSNPRPVTEYEQFAKTADGKPICPKCGRSDKVRQYLYGLLREDPPEGMVWGCCTVHEDSPEYRCGHCGTKFGLHSMREAPQQPDKAAE